MEKETLFSIVPDDILLKYRQKGYHYVDSNYINIFRWLWNEKHIHPNIYCFPKNITNKYRVTLYNNDICSDEVSYGEDYDNAIIWVVNKISKNIDSYIDK